MKSDKGELSRRSSRDSAFVADRVDPFRFFVDTANAGAGLNADLDVSMVAPGGGPRVADKEVLNTVLNAPADSGDGVIELGSASGAGENSRLVVLENSFVSLNSDRHNSLGDSGLKLIRVVPGNLGGLYDVDASTSSLGGVARSGLACS